MGMRQYQIPRNKKARCNNKDFWIHISCRKKQEKKSPPDHSLLEEVSRTLVTEQSRRTILALILRAGIFHVVLPVRIERITQPTCAGSINRDSHPDLQGSNWRATMGFKRWPPVTLFSLIVRKVDVAHLLVISMSLGQ